MDPQADSDEEFVVLSTSDYTESPSYARAQAGGLENNAKLFVKSIRSLTSLLGARVTEFQASGTAGIHIPKNSETIKQIADHRSVTNYNYIINGGRGGSGGEGGNQGGDVGTGQGPTVYFCQPEAREPPEFQTIRLGDLRLVKEIRLSSQSGIVGRRSGGVSIPRIYHAEIRLDPGTVTVAMYQGEGAEEEWRQHVAKYESIRHPNIMQLYGLVSTKGLYAMVFHDELIPYTQFLRRFQHSPILRTYIIGYCDTEFKEAVNYIEDVFRESSIDDDNSQIWIRPLTGELCLDLAQGGAETISELPWSDAHILRLENVSLDAPNSEDIIIPSLSEDQYHRLCSNHPIHRFQCFQASTQHPVGPGIFRSDSQYGTWVRITEPLMLPEEQFCWDLHWGGTGEVMPNSYDSREEAWLARANHIFAELEEEAHVEDYVCVYGVTFILRIADKHQIPKGYLFICPPQDFRTSNEAHANLYQWPPCPAYWSLDPSGAARLSMEDTRVLGFSAIHIETVMDGSSWDHSVYKGLQRFHEGKGFNPDSQEVARQLGYQFYKVLSDRASAVPFLVHKGEPHLDG
ncbi:hypothetical protein MSAN_02278600 [Mycena sanguinolenta]|uniref:Protein kinase domain-containing protein n=1 Tax=Mycena sanguinolenta TaxID=230812 RepID=A0A8H6XB13_9AGAR|nr:hypothetical protein MSAN_02278600 [Mycena sanguinolenta]